MLALILSITAIIVIFLFWLTHNLEKERGKKPEILFLAEDHYNKYNYDISSVKETRVIAPSIYKPNFNIISTKIPPLRGKRGAIRKTKNSLINDDFEYILFDKDLRVEFDYSGPNGVNFYQVDIVYITGTIDGVPLYLRGSTIEDEDIEDMDNPSRSLTFRMDKILNIQSGGEMYSTLEAFIKSLPI